MSTPTRRSTDRVSGPRSPDPIRTTPLRTTPLPTDSLPSDLLIDGVEVEHRFVDLPGLRVHVAEAGAGEPVLLLHGFPQHWWEWRRVIPGLAQQYRVICPDLRGAGWSDAPPGGYERDQLLADVVALLDALPIDRVRIVAHDWGAIVAYLLCLAHPDRVRAHLSLSIPPPTFSWDRRLLKGMASGALLFELVLPLPVVGPRVLSRGEQRFGRYLLTSFATDPAAFSPQDIETFLERLRDPARAAAGSALYRGFILREAYRMMRGRYRDRRLTTPTRVLIGADDVAFPFDALHGFEDYVDDVTLVSVPGASHFVADDRSDVVVEAALELFARH